MKVLKFGLALLLILLAGGCSTKQVQTQTILLVPPAPLLQPCPETNIPAEGTNGALLEVAIALRLGLAECNQSKARLREWVDAQLKTEKAGR